MNITLRQLDYLMALAQTRHFGRAAEACHVTQPALSTQIRELEARLGATLIERGGREVRLTPVGEEVLAAARSIRRELERIEQAVTRRVGLDGRLRLGVIPTVAPYLLPHAIPLLRAGRPSLDLRVREARTGELVEGLLEGRLDAAVMALPAGRPGLEEAPLFEERFLLAATRGELARLAEGRMPSPRGLDPDRLLLLEEGHCLADQALEVCGIDRASLGTDLGAASLSTLTRLAAEGFGLTLLPEIAVAAETAAAPGLAVMRFAAPEPVRRIGLVRRARASRIDGADGRRPQGAGWQDDWFDELAHLFARAGRAAVAEARHALAANPACAAADGGARGDALEDGQDVGERHA
jgi:LysR family hydrogen peroxide-inducible transcriptional activator